MTPTQELIEIRMPAGQTLAGLVLQRRKAGIGWRRIADEIGNSTGVIVSHATVKRWFNELDRKLGTPRAGVVHDKAGRVA